MRPTIILVLSAWDMPALGMLDTRPPMLDPWGTDTTGGNTNISSLGFWPAFKEEEDRLDYEFSIRAREARIAKQDRRELYIRDRFPRLAIVGRFVTLPKRMLSVGVVRKLAFQRKRQRVKRFLKAL